MKEFDAFEYIERDEDGSVDESFLVLYAGEGLNPKYPDDWNFWLWLPRYNMWERHSVDKRAELREPSDYQKEEIIKALFLANKWVKQ